MQILATNERKELKLKRKSVDVLYRKTTACVKEEQKEN